MFVGIYILVKWLIWMGLFVYGSVDVMVVFLKFFFIDILCVFIVIYLGMCKDNDFLRNFL